MFDKNDLFRLEDHDYINIPAVITYNSSIDDDMIDVLKETATKDFYFTKIADKLCFKENYVELILHVLNHLDLVEYGTSPRGSWITERGKKYLEFVSSENPEQWLIDNKEYSNE